MSSTTNSLVKFISQQNNEASHQMAQIFAVAQVLEREVKAMHEQLRLQQQIPAQVMLRDPVTIRDAWGNISAFSLNHVTNLPAFVDMMKRRREANDPSDSEDIVHSMFDGLGFVPLVDQRILPLAESWEKILSPGQTIDMMIFNKRARLNNDPVLGSNVILAVRLGLCTASCLAGRVLNKEKFNYSRLSFMKVGWWNFKGEWWVVGEW